MTELLTYDKIDYLRAFLDERGKKESFFHLCNKRYKCMLILLCSPNYFYNIIDDSITWQGSKEGFDYWYNLDSSFRNNYRLKFKHEEY